MKKNLILITLLTLALIGFGFHSTKIKQEPQKTVHLNIEKSDTIMKWVVLEEVQNQFYNESVFKKYEKETENLDFTFNLSNPKLFRFYCLTPPTAPILVYITPGDSIIYKLNEKKSIVFKGKNASHYNFFKQLNDLDYQYPIYNEKEGIEKYKENTKLTYQKRLFFFRAVY